MIVVVPTRARAVVIAIIHIPIGCGPPLPRLLHLPPPPLEAAAPRVPGCHRRRAPRGRHARARARAPRRRLSRGRLTDGMMVLDLRLLVRWRRQQRGPVTALLALVVGHLLTRPIPLYIKQCIIYNLMGNKRVLRIDRLPLACTVDVTVENFFGGREERGKRARRARIDLIKVGVNVNATVKRKRRERGEARGRERVSRGL